MDSEIRKKYCYVFYDIRNDLEEGFYDDLERDDIEDRVVIKKFHERLLRALREYFEYKDMLFQMVAKDGILPFQRLPFQRSSFCIDLCVAELKGIKILTTIEDIKFTKSIVLYLRGVLMRCDRYLAAALDFIHPSILSGEYRGLLERSDYAADLVSLFSCCEKTKKEA